MNSPLNKKNECGECPLYYFPCFGRLGREVEELRLDGFFLGCEQLGGSDGVSGGSILPLELFVLHHQQDLFVGGADEMPGC